MDKLLIFIFLLGLLIFTYFNQGKILSYRVQAYYQNRPAILNDVARSNKYAAIIFSQGEPIHSIDNLKPYYSSLYTFITIDMNNKANAKMLQEYKVRYSPDFVFYRYQPYLFLENPKNGYKIQVDNPNDANLVKNQLDTFVRHNYRS